MKIDHLYIELTNYCNLKCVICPNAELKRPRGFMASELYYDLIEKARGQFHAVNFSYFGEPLLHPNADELMAALKDRDFEVYINTNTFFLGSEMRGTLADIEVDQLRISIDSMIPSTYNKIRVGSDYERVVKNAKAFLRIKDRGSVRVVMVANKHNDKEEYSFIQFWKPLLKPGDEILIKGPISWQGAVRDPKRNHQGTCPMWDGQTVVVAWDGMVSPCYLDYEQELALSDFPNIDILDLESSPEFRKIAWSDDKPRVCQHCTDKNYDIKKIVCK